MIETHIDLDSYDPDWKLAQNHGKATKPGKPTKIDLQNHQNAICKCCNNYINKQQQPIFNNCKQLDFLGVGFPVYFLFIKHCIALVLLMVISYNALSLYKAVILNAGPCSHQEPDARLLSAGTGLLHCTSWMIYMARTDAEVTGDQIIIRIFSYILHLLMLIYMRDSITKTIQYFDQRTCSMSDFTLQIKGLPLEDGIKAKLQQFFGQAFAQKNNHQLMDGSSNSIVLPRDGYKIMQLTLVPHTQQFEQKQKKKRHILKQIYAQNDKKQKKPQLIQELKKNLQKISKQLKEEISEFGIKIQSDKLQAPKAIITLNTQQQIKQVHEIFQKLSSTQIQKYFIGDSSQLQIIEVPQPKEIIWHDINYPEKKRIFLVLLGWALSVGFIAIATVVFYFILVAKSHYLEEHAEAAMGTAIFLVYFLIIIVIFFNKFVMGPVLHYFTHLERHQSSDKSQASFALKYALGMFFTTALMTLAVQVVSFHNFYTHLYGVIQQQTVFFFFNAFFVPLVWIINPFQLLVLLKRKYYHGSKHITQRQANKVMQDFQYDMGKRYAQILQTMWFTFLYLTLIPIGAMFTVIGLAVYYWIDKYNLLRRSSITSNVSGNMGLYALRQLDFTLLCRAAGEAIVDSQIRDGVQTETIVFLCISAVYLILPLDQIIDFFNHEEFYDESKTFIDVKDKFKDTYQTLHPIYSKIHQKQFSTRLKSLILDSLNATTDILNVKSNSHLTL